MGVGLVAAGAWSGLAIAWDLRSRRIPNGLTLGAAGVALACFAATGRGPLGAPWAASMVAAAAAMAPAVALFAANRLGAGDVKFMTALPLVAGPESALRAFALGSALLFAWAGACGIGAVLAHRRRANGGPPELARILPRRSIPLAPPFGAGLLVELARLA